MTGRRSREARGSSSSSFLVRMWREPQASGSGPVRVYLRNLQTGEELYLGDPKRVGEVLSHAAAVVDEDGASNVDQTSTANAG